MDHLRTQGLRREGGDGRGARLVVIEGGPPTSIELTADALAIGRASQNDLTLASESVSRRHARLLLAERQWQVEDLESYNGTTVNGLRVEPGQPRPLLHKDVIGVGDYRLLFLAHLDARGEKLLSTIVVDKGKVKEEAERALREFLQ